MKGYSLEESLRELGKDVEKLSQDMMAKAKLQVQTAAAMAYSMIVEKANSRLKSTRSKYIDALNIQSIQSDGTNEIWAVTLNKSAKWLEEGTPRHEMIDDLVNGPKSKISKDGFRYNVIPFDHSGPSANKSRAQNKIASYVKSELKKRGLDQTITKNGKPVLGRAATVNLTDKGSPINKFNKPLLSGLTIYQREVKTKKGDTKIKRDIMTFRVVSEKQKGSGSWVYPEKAPLNFFAETARDLDEIWGKMVKEIAENA